MQVMDYHEAIFASDLTPPQKLVALAISKHYNWKKQLPAFPSNKTLARETSLAVSSIVKAKRVLLDRGFITSNQRWNASSEYGCNIPEQYPCSQIETNNEYNNELNNEKKKDSNESLNLITEVKAEDDSAINNISFDDIFYKFERITDEERNHRPAPAGSGYKERRGSNSPVGRYDIDDAELAAFNQELARTREESW
jgi:hypothetical protein